MLNYINDFFIILCINIILAISLNFVNGMAGQLSLGHAGFMAIGAYTAAIFSKIYEYNIYSALIIGATAAAIAGFFIGIPAFKLKKNYIAFFTLAFGEIIRVTIINTDSFLGKELTGGALGLKDIKGVDGIEMIILCIILVMITFIIIKNIMNSNEGRAVKILKEDEIIVESIGIDTKYYKLFSFVIGALLAGMAGALFAYNKKFIEPENFNIIKTLEIVLMIVIGGLGSISGAVIGAVIVSIFYEIIKDYSEYRIIVYSLILILFMLFRRQGIFGKKEIWEIISKRKKG